MNRTTFKFQADGEVKTLSLTDLERWCLQEKLEKLGAFDDLDSWLETNEDEDTPTDEQRERIIDEYLETKSNDWFDWMSNAYYKVMHTVER